MLTEPGDLGLVARLNTSQQTDPVRDLTCQCRICSRERSLEVSFSSPSLNLFDILSTDIHIFQLTLNVSFTRVFLCIEYGLSF
jgi:hypothetical protein